MSVWRDELQDLQLSATVEQRERMAIIIPVDGQAFEAIAQQRTGLLARAAALGVSHLAIEVPDPL